MKWLIIIAFTTKSLQSYRKPLRSNRKLDNGRWFLPS